MTTTWLLCDYGEVLCLPQPPDDRRSLEAVAGKMGPEFWSIYWDHRSGYDRGDVTAADYWTAVLGRRPGPESLERLVACDTAGWLHPNHDALAAAARARARGLRLALFSNAPHEVADAIDRQEWLAGFHPRLFSCRLGAIKPEPAAYQKALTALHAAPGDVIFLDDRLPNVEAARAAGIRAELFVDPAQFDSVECD
jgi:putative hydrolase of the HAD superfamily